MCANAGLFTLDKDHQMPLQTIYGHASLAITELRDFQGPTPDAIAPRTLTNNNWIVVSTGLAHMPASSSSVTHSVVGTSAAAADPVSGAAPAFTSAAAVPASTSTSATAATYPVSSAAEAPSATYPVVGAANTWPFDNNTDDGASEATTIRLANHFGYDAFPYDPAFGYRTPSTTPAPLTFYDGVVETDTKPVTEEEQQGRPRGGEDQARPRGGGEAEACPGGRGSPGRQRIETRPITRKVV
ncbi:hypothetical protein LTR50_006122 [Elasticomyces elasticus]|nr:hypothetical protein LTR50_006122 [Elasticomyces elasticus]